jgi:hypothetical protein
VWRTTQNRTLEEGRQKNLWSYLFSFETKVKYIIKQQSQHLTIIAIHDDKIEKNVCFRMDDGWIMRAHHRKRTAAGSRNSPTHPQNNSNTIIVALHADPNEPNIIYKGTRLSISNHGR